MESSDHGGDVIAQGLLGGRKEFKSYFEGPIRAGLDKDASKLEKTRSARVAEELRSMYSLYFLRREKASVTFQKTWQ